MKKVMLAVLVAVIGLALVAARGGPEVSRPVGITVEEISIETVSYAPTPGYVNKEFVRIWILTKDGVVIGKHKVYAHVVWDDGELMVEYSYRKLIDVENLQLYKWVRGPAWGWGTFGWELKHTFHSEGKLMSSVSTDYRSTVNCTVKAENPGIMTCTHKVTVIS